MNRAKVINMSWTITTNYPFLEQALRDAWNAGLVSAGAAGNASENTLFYPAAYSHVMGVTGTRQSEVKQTDSAWGMWVDVAAPGRGLWTTGYDPATGQHQYAYSLGTTPSLAVPHVSGLAGLLFSYLGTSTPQDRIFATIKYSTDDINGANDPTQDYWGFMGTGRIDSYQALQMAQNTLVVPTQYATIAAAMDAATAGQTVYVRPGTYNEYVSMKSGVKLIASRSDSTTISGAVTFNNISNAEVSGFTITDYVAVNVYNSTGITIRNGRLTGANWGTTINYANPTVRNNEILSNTIGIYLSTGTGTGVVAQNNRIQNNGKGFYVRSTPTLQNRHNSIKGNTTYDLEATSESGYIYAQRNWWGENPPNPDQIVTVNGIDYSNYLTEDPIPSTHTPPKLVVRAFHPVSTGGDGGEASVLYRQGRELLEGGHLEAAIDVYQQVVRQFPDAPLAQVALKELVGAYHQLGASEIADRYLREVIDRALTSALGRAARRLQFDLLVLPAWRQTGKRSMLGHWPWPGCWSRSLRELNLPACCRQAEEVAFQAALATLFGLGARQEGEDALRTYLAQYPQEVGNAARQVRRQLAHAYLKELPEGERAIKAIPATTVILEPGVPNPFNPQTVIA